MGLDYSQFNKLFEQNEELLKRNKQFNEDVITEMAIRIYNQTILRTPVDTGVLRGAWQLGNIQWYSTTVMIPLINNMDYASFVEYGHKTRSGGYVEPVFMAKKSIEEVNDKFEDLYDGLFLLTFSDVL